MRQKGNPLRNLNGEGMVFNTYLEEIPSVLVRIIDTDRSAADSDVEADSEVGWLERHVGAIRLQDHLSIEEGSLHRAAVHHFGLDHQN